MRTSRMRLATAAIVLALILAACGGDETPTDTGPAPTTGATGAETGATGPAGAQVTTSEADLGTILTDAEGRTLYLFEADTDGTSTCYDDCAANWPALTTDGEPQAGDGVDASLLGTTERDDGTVQVTYAGQPLYYFAGDAAAGDTNGQGVSEVWYVVAPDGSKIS